MYQASEYLLKLVTGYKLRTRIAKALQTWSEAIRRALARYNTEAQKLRPPQPKLTWNEIVDYSFLGEFDLLRHACTDIHTELWANPLRREATIKYLRLYRAKEEIKWLNREVRRLRTSIHDESCEMTNCIEHISHTNPPLAVEMARQWQLRSKVNAINIGHLDYIEAMVGFSGVRGIGIRLHIDEAQFPRAPHFGVLPPPAEEDATEAQVTETAAREGTNPLVDATAPLSDPVVDEILAQDMAHMDILDPGEVLNELEGVTEFVCSIND